MGAGCRLRARAAAASGAARARLRSARRFVERRAGARTLRAALRGGARRRSVARPRPAGARFRSQGRRSRHRGRDGARPPPHPRHRARPAARQDQIPAGRVRIDAARLYAPAIAAHGRGARRGSLAQAEFSPLGRAAGTRRGDRRDQRRHWRPAGATCPLPPRGLARAARARAAAARGPARRGLTPSFRRLTGLEGRSILGGHLPRRENRMALAITPLHPHIGAEVGGLDLSRPIDSDTVAELWRAIDRHAVLVFHDQQISDRQLYDFAARFGELEIGRGALQGGRRRLSIPQIGDISNLDEDNRLRARDDRRRLDSLGNRLWHTDASYMPVPVVLGMLFAVAVPPASPFGGGETEFADMRAAYDALGDKQKAVIDPLIAEHDIFWSRAQIGFTEFPPGEREKYPPSRQRLVRRHPGSGRKCLYLSAHASHIAGWPIAEGRLLLHDLSEHATQARFVYSHKWLQGDLVIWDNRDTMHRGRPHDENYPRDLRRATTLDVGSTLDEAA